MKSAFYASLHPCYQNGWYICDCGNIAQTIDEHRQHLLQSRQCLKNNATLGDKEWIFAQVIMQDQKIPTCHIIFNHERGWVGAIWKAENYYRYLFGETRKDGGILIDNIDWTPTLRKAKEILFGNFYETKWKQVTQNNPLAADLTSAGENHS
jgi:hypothetical protein